MYETTKGQAVTAMANLLLKMNGEDGPMIKNILNMLLCGIDNWDSAEYLYGPDLERYEKLKELAAQLNRGQYNVLND